MQGSHSIIIQNCEGNLDLISVILIGCIKMKFLLSSLNRRQIIYINNHHISNLRSTRRIIVLESQTNAIDAMSLIGRRRVSFTLEDMPQVSATIAADNLRPRHTERIIGMSCHSAGNRIEVRGPTAT